MTEIDAEKQLSDHRAAVAATMSEIAKVPSAGYGRAAILARVTNALRVASANDPGFLSGREKREMLEALGGLHGSLMKATSDPAQASMLTNGLNVMGTLVLAWAGDSRWTRGGGPFRVTQNFALSWQLELMSTAVLDQIAAEQEKFSASRRTVIERLMSAGAMEN